MPEVVWIGLYFLGAVASVPIVARWFYEPEGEGVEASKEASVGFALTFAIAWPAELVVGIGVVLSRRLPPLIFGTGKKRGEQ